MFKLWQGDSIEVLKGFPDKSVDAIITDPPSGTNMMVPFQTEESRYMSFDNVGRLRYNFQTQSRVMKKLRPNFEQQVFPVFSEMSRVLKSGGYGVVWGFHRSLHWTMAGLEQADLSVTDIIVRRLRRKRPKSPLVREIYSTQLVQETELWILVRKDGEPTATETFDKFGTGYLQVKDLERGERQTHLIEDHPKNKSLYGHPTEKSVGWMRKLVRMICPKGGLVLDPFMGVGTTGEAALLEDREFWGIELNPNWFSLASKRLNQFSKDTNFSTMKSDLLAEFIQDHNEK